MKINLLGSKIYNRIAAGEVVERPFSVVKELVENSIDAGAKNIKIEIENGGISSIVITDDGCGIEKSELKKALMPHATSKISSLKDLDNIISLGFRGEALASIASVSKLSITSKTAEQDIGAKISADGGEMGLVEDCAASTGTVISVKNLFFNTPVREKFLRTERAEESEITATVSRFILGHPEISFKYVADGETIYASYGDGVESAMVCVYGVDVINNCFSIDVEKNGIKISGYIGKHHFTKGNRSYQTTFINGRFVVNQTVASAIANAYASYLMKRQYPFYVINLNIPSEIVDVNVHPNKLDVRFANNQIIYGTLYSVVSKVLDGTSEALNIIVDNNKNIQLKTDDLVKDYVKHNQPNISSAQKYEPLVFNDSKAKSLSFDDELFSNNKPINEKDKVVDIFAENKAFLESLEKKKVEEIVEKNIATQQTDILCQRDFKYIGQVLNTYILFEDGVDLFFADQHAAHERILFDKLNDSLKNNQIISQPLLLPYVLNVNNAEYEFLCSKSELLNSMGIELNEFGKNAFKVSAIPSFLTEMNIKVFFDDILSDLSGLKNLTVNDILADKIAQKACKAAVKSGDVLDKSEIDVLLNKLKENIGLKCPHGRPVVVKITRMEIDKWFKRIV